MGNSPGFTPTRVLSRTVARDESADSAERLRVVMVVANDVTRDSRVLREASTLAAAGHRVTVLGIMTAKTTAPEVEVRDGFVIRRLRYRARPPGWWIPPDFYARIRYRADRQLRIHRARVSSLLRRMRRDRRLARARRQAARRAAAPLTGWGTVANRVVRRPAHAATRLTATGRERVRRLRRLARRARRAPRATWIRKGNEAAVRSRAWMRRALARRGSGHHVIGRGRAARPSRRRVARRIRPAASAIARHAAERLAAAPLALVRAVGRVLHAWGSILALLAWGSVYLLANRLTAGAIEWQTGWRWRWMGWARFVADQAPDADVWHGHDMTSLPAIVELKRRRGGFAIYDSHEVYFESGKHAEQPRWAKAPLEALERSLVAEVDAVVSVNRSVAAILEERLGCSQVQVLYNCPPRATGILRGAPLRRALGLGPSTPLLMYHGSLSPHRGIEQLLAAIQRPELADAHLAFMGFGSMLEWLRREVTEPRYGGRIQVLDAVEPDALPRWLQGVDVAVAPIQASTLNHRNSSPNKVFEAIAAGTPVAGSDFPEFRRVINDPAFGPLGVLFDPADPGDIARGVRQILDASPTERTALRQRCRAASARRWNWETESRSLVTLYDGLAARRASNSIAEVRVA